MNRLLKKPEPIDVFLALFLYVLNAVDCFLTLWVVGLAGTAMENNIFMRAILTLGSAWFMAVKLGGGAILTCGLLFYPIPRRFSMALAFCSLVYFVFTVYHLVGIWRSSVG